MPAKKVQARRSPKTQKRKTTLHNHCRWLLLIDNEPIRAAAVSEYHELEEQLRATREKIEAFESGDLPAYQRWEASAFGPLLTELRTVLQELDQKRRILDAIEDEVIWGHCSYVTAYRRVMKAIESPEPEVETEEPQDEAGGPESDFADNGGERLFGDRDLPRDFDIDEFDRSSKQKQRKFRDYYETMAAMYEMFTGLRAPDLDVLLERERARKRGGEGATGTAYGADADTGATRRRGEPREPEADHRSTRLKELYRMLVRQLHPDMASEQTHRERELWHEVQEAYRTRDLGRMEALAGRVEIGISGSAIHLPLQILHRMTRDLRDALRGLRSHVTQIRKHPAWLFRTKAKELAKMEAKRRRSLTADLRLAKADLSMASEELEDIAAMAKARPKRSRNKKPVAKKSAAKKSAAKFSDNEPF